MSSASVSLLAEKVSTLKMRYGQLDELGSGGVAVRQLPPPNFQQAVHSASHIPRVPEVRVDVGLPVQQVMAPAHQVVRPALPPREIVLLQGPNPNYVGTAGGLVNNTGNAQGNVNQQQQQQGENVGLPNHHLYAPQSDADVSALEQQQHLQSPSRQRSPGRQQQEEGEQQLGEDGIPIVSESSQLQAAALRPAQDAEVLRKLIADEVMRQHGFQVSNRDSGGMLSVAGDGQGGIREPRVPPAQPMSAATLQHHASSPIERPRDDQGHSMLGGAESLFFSTPGKNAEGGAISHPPAGGAAVPLTTDVMFTDNGGRRLADGQHGGAAAQEDESRGRQGDEDHRYYQGHTGAPAAIPPSSYQTVTKQVYGALPVPHSVSTHHHEDPNISIGVGEGREVGPSRLALRAAERAASRGQGPPRSREGIAVHRPASRAGARLGKPQPYHQRARPQPVPEDEDFEVAKGTYNLDTLLAHPGAKIGAKEQAALLEEAHKAYGSIARQTHSGKSDLVKQYPNILSKPRSLTQYPQPASVGRLMERLSDHALSLKKRNGFQHTAGVKGMGGGSSFAVPSSKRGLVDDQDEQQQSRPPRLSSKHGTRRTREGSLRPKSRGHNKDQLESWGQGVQSPVRR